MDSARRIIGSVLLALVGGCTDASGDGDSDAADASTGEATTQVSGTPTGEATASTTGAPTTTAQPTTDPTPGTSGDSTDGGEETGNPDLPQPILPEPDGECPDFTAGDQRIGDLQTTIFAGTPGDSKGTLLLYWHGTGSSPGVELPLLIPAAQGDEILGGGGLIIAPQSNGADRGGFTPNGVWYEGEAGVGGDLAWADHIVACAVENHNIDPRRIYTTGCSAGGLMAGGFALKRSNYIAAATPNSGGIIVGGADQIQNPETLPAIMTMHGGTNDTVIVNFAQTSATLNNLLTKSGGFAVDCNHMSTHCGAPVDLQAAAWEFLKAHPFGTTPYPYADALPESFPGYCEIW